ncbi:MULTISPECIES: MlaE family ABC transporter permease [Winogradskyella]|uniref:Phospholipid/cholesterol/gamma-HCH transport system permease protein n=2 Tax=Winogradskyella TaxID=286104 RepID=A0A368ZAQ2_9FLAO|nr:ABC transporter permease [Winogradskyella arenosi]RCW89920.1 phospholipid/cholesterol/gamma-HCH transport system permease protein [Winogradskyella arenosi]
MTYLHNIGTYFIMIKDIFRRPTKWSVMKPLILKDIDDLIIGSLGIVAFISFFVGGVVAIQTSLNMTSPIMPKYLVGFATRQSIILEFAPTFISIIMAGKVGSFITSSIGTMRVTEQIDALEVMGINAINYLVFPKFIALTLYPFVISIAMFLGILGGLMACVYGGYGTMEDYLEGVQLDFIPFHFIYAFIKTFVFAFLLATIPSYYGYFMKGGALEVGKASTTSFVWTSVLVIIVNFLLTSLLLG